MMRLRKIIMFMILLLQAFHSIKAMHVFTKMPRSFLITPAMSNLLSHQKINDAGLIKLRGGARKTKQIPVVNANRVNSDDIIESESDNDNFDDQNQQPNAISSWLDSSTILESVKNTWKKTPPITQIYMASTISVTILSALLNNNRWPAVLQFDWYSIIGKLQIWRIYTSFLHLGALDIFYPLTLQFIWQHMAQLEKMSYNKPEEFFTLTLFGATSLIAIYTLFGFNMHYLGHNFATYLVYIWSRVFEGTDVNVMDLITLKSEMIPWFFCLQSLILDRELPLPDLIGIAVGHVYYYLKQKKALTTPEFVKRLFSSQSIRDKYARFKADFE